MGMTKSSPTPPPVPDDEIPLDAFMSECKSERELAEIDRWCNEFEVLDVDESSPNSRNPVILDSWEKK